MDDRDIDSLFEIDWRLGSGERDFGLIDADLETDDEETERDFTFTQSEFDWLLEHYEKGSFPLWIVVGLEGHNARGVR